jgi:S1-C subfamily serine protease
VRGADKITVMRADGRPLVTTDTMEMARDGRDLVRFRMVADLGGLRRAESMRIGETVYALGNSGGLNVLTPLVGQMIGVGAKEIEVTSPFIPGNSGGPILNRRNEVLGVATYVASSRGEWWAQGTRFSRVRRLATRIDGVDWVPLSLKNFQKADLTVESAMDKIEVIEKWKRIVRANARSPRAKESATQLIRASGRLESELRGLSVAARIPFLKEDVERVQGYNRKLKDELHALLKQVKE